MSNRFKHGLFIISLDFELYWGVRDKRTLESYQEHLGNTPAAIDGMLNLFTRYGIHATWATVGALFLSHRAEFLATESARPGYKDQNLCPYIYAESREKLEPTYHFAPELIKNIANQPGQEIGTHTFSHYYCAEKGASPASFAQDIEQARKSSKNLSLDLKSIVFPRNQWKENFLPALQNTGIGSFRGNPEHWAYHSASESEQSLARRALRLADSYINLTGDHNFSPQRHPTGLINIPASAFFRPYTPKLAWLEPLRLRRIKESMKAAAWNHQGYHLWWHPHNFGSHLQQNLDNLESILVTFTKLRESHGLQSLNMSEVEQGIRNGNLLENT